MKIMKNDPEMLEEYDFSNGIRGKYASKYRSGSNVVRLDPDLLEYFPNSASVNEALRSLVEIMKKYGAKRAAPVGSVDG